MLNKKLNEEFGCARCNYHNKDINNSHNRYLEKTMHTNYGDITVAIPCGCNDEYKLQQIKKYSNTTTQNMTKKSLHNTKRTAKKLALPTKNYFINLISFFPHFCDVLCP